MSVCDPSMRRGDSDEYGLGFRSCMSLRSVAPTRWSVLHTQLREAAGVLTDLSMRLAYSATETNPPDCSICNNTEIYPLNSALNEAELVSQRVGQNHGSVPTFLVVFFQCLSAEIS
jgi:hypothetical protein